MASVALLTGCATADEWPEGQRFKVSPRFAAHCKAEGGCEVFTAKNFHLQLLRAFTAGVESVKEAEPAKPGDAL